MFSKAALILTTVYMLIASTRSALQRGGHTTNIKLKFPDSEVISTNRLLLFNCSLISDVNAVDNIRSIIAYELNLEHLEYHILQATSKDKGLLFEMSSPQEVNQILENFALLFKSKDCGLKLTFDKFIDLEIR